jgi:hypothetical protein
MKQKLLRRLLIILLIAFSVLPFVFLYKCWIKPEHLLGYLWAIPLAALALFQEELRKFLSAPQLTINFKLEESFCLKCPAKVLEPPNTIIDTEAYYFRFKVNNTGRSQAKNCECFVESLRKFVNGKWEPDKTFQPMNLAWSNGRGGEDGLVDINSNSYGVFCDLVHVGHLDIVARRSPDLFIDYGVPVPFSQIKRLSINTRYQLDVVVYAENAELSKSTFEILFSGNWKDESADMFNEISITKINS